MDMFDNLSDTPINPNFKMPEDLDDPKDAKKGGK
jgi:hypothetical protein